MIKITLQFRSIVTKCILFNLFLLSNHAVYLLVWNSRLGFEHSRLEFWLSSVSSHCPEAPIFLIGTHIDQVCFVVKICMVCTFYLLHNCIISLLLNGDMHRRQFPLSNTSLICRINLTQVTAYYLVFSFKTLFIFHTNIYILMEYLSILYMNTLFCFMI